MKTTKAIRVIQDLMPAAGNIGNGSDIMTVAEVENAWFPVTPHLRRYYEYKFIDSTCEVTPIKAKDIVARAKRLLKLKAFA